MKQLPKALFAKSLDSLVLAIEHFNRPWDRGRHEAVLILLDRAFELLLKSLILHQGGKIREPYEKETIGFEKCVRKCITDAEVKCLTEEEGLTIQIINSFRDAAQHDIVELTEQELYLYCQAGITLYKDLIDRVLGEQLANHLPERVLPISTNPPKDLHTMIEADFNQIKELVKPKTRRQLEAKAKLKALAIVESSLEGVRSQPSDLEVKKLVKDVQAGKAWRDMFPGIASLQLSSTGTGINVDIRITKKEGEAVHLVPEGTPGATVLAVKRVNELDYYSLSPKSFAEKLELTQPKALALAKHLKLQESEDYFKIIKIGKSLFNRYSGKAFQMAKKALKDVDLEAVWKEHRPKRK
ncbi:MAG: hypothetical protein CMP07_14000 [Xanthomonadales bacterium]|nr:hypothetical protein [Xanthomonadales bacterium]|tara:strand:- start:2072 stop:3136 length:1065 start_codon:yes stop_codon:yes gene_type:complete